jgi:DNA-binding NtrC family response regulator
MPNLLKIVIVDDDEVNLTFCQRVLQDYETFPFRDPKKALTYCAQNDFDLVLTDMRMPGMTGIGLIQEIRKKKDDFAALIVSAYNDSEYLMEAVNAANISQYLLKPVEAVTLTTKVAEALRHLNWARQKKLEEQRLAEQAQKLLEENTQLRFHASSPLAALVGTNPSVVKIKEQIKSFALSDYPVLITGEEGTGKKLVARLLHELSDRKNTPYAAISTATIPEDLLEAEIFGAAKGPQTGLKAPKEGFLDRLEGGTLSVEEVEGLPKTLQSKILKFLQYGTYYPVGGTEEKSADVRMLFSSKSNLAKEMEEGSVRKDLFFKVANLQIKTLPLRERREDILAIMEALAKRENRRVPNLDPKQKEILVRYSYPGNIRELHGILEKLNLVMGDRPEGTVHTEEIERILKDNAQIYSAIQGTSAPIKTVQLPPGHEPVDMRAFVDAIEKEIITTALKFNDNNISQTSRNLMISRQGLKNKIKRYEIPVDIDGDDDA